MDFSKPYNRIDFVNFLRRDFLPDDFEQTDKNVSFGVQMNYATSAKKLGACKSLDLVVYEIRHTSHNDARVGLSKDAFRMLAKERQNRALVIFVPDDTNANYRFSLVEIQLTIGENDTNVTRTYSNPRRYSYYLGEGIACYTPNKYLNELGKVTNVKDLFERFSVEVLTKAFYNELSDWYAWAIKEITFPNDLSTTEDDTQYNHIGAIRLITRLIFVWFIKQRGLVPEQFFDEDYIRENLLENFNPNAKVDLFYKATDSKYYRAILQNLFFAMLNAPLCKEGCKEITERKFMTNRGQHDDNKLMRYRDLFKNPDLFLQLANSTVPFLNGGLFDCLDDKKSGMYYDGFSERKESIAQLRVPDYLFFGEEVGRGIDLSDYYGDTNKKKVSARGIIDILKRYNFTVEENMPFDKDISLDPELLGKVFENLLAAYNPETKQTARKQTGSFYTPREIVQYMVDESLVAHLKRTVSEDLESEYRKLLSYSDDVVNLDEDQKQRIMQSLYNCKILDPACGSGAFPVGILQQMVHILTQIDPDNSRWQKMLFDIAQDESSEVFKNSTDEERKEQLDDLYHSFNADFNRPDYSRKLYLIENCIYGVDIQPIAIQISKLRFFISLIIDQKPNNDPTDNFGIRPLPNLEAKFVAANSLIGLKREEENLFNTAEIKEKEDQLKISKHKIFGAKTARTKRKYENQVAELRAEIASMLVEQRLVGNEQAQQLSQWDMSDQNASSPFFDPEWMFGVKDGFDIVIANPPYIEFKNYPKSEKDRLKHYKTAKGKFDIYILFVERGSMLLRENGVLTYICPTRFLKRDYGSALRKYIQENLTISTIVDFADTQIFENVLTYTGIFMFINSQNEDNYSFRYSLSINDFYESIDSSVLDSNIWDFALGNRNTLLEKISKGRATLGNISDGIVQGIATGKDSVFLLNNEELMTYNIERDIVRPFLKGKDINQYKINWSGLYVIYPYDENGKVIPENSLSNRYPNTYKYLLSKRLDLKGRSYFDNSTKLWFELWNQRKPSRFNGIKIVTLDNASKNSFSVDTDSFYGTTTVYNIKLTDPNLSYYYVVGILNSKVLDYFHKSKTVPQANGFYRYQSIFIRDLPIAIAEKQIQEQIEKLVRHISEPYANKSIIQQKIDHIVYHLYGLNYDEVLIVDPQTPISREQYDNLKLGKMD